VFLSSVRLCVCDHPVAVPAVGGVARGRGGCGLCDGALMGQGAGLGDCRTGLSDCRAVLGDCRDGLAHGGTGLGLRTVLLGHCWALLL
jgi:hypothetical protein